MIVYLSNILFTNVEYPDSLSYGMGISYIEPELLRLRLGLSPS